MCVWVKCVWEAIHCSWSSTDRNICGTVAGSKNFSARKKKSPGLKMWHVCTRVFLCVFVCLWMCVCDDKWTLVEWWTENTGSDRDTQRFNRPVRWMDKQMFISPQGWSLDDWIRWRINARVTTHRRARVLLFLRSSERRRYLKFSQRYF